MPRFTLDTPFTITHCGACSTEGDKHLSHIKGGCIAGAASLADVATFPCKCGAGPTEAELEGWLNDDD